MPERYLAIKESLLKQGKPEKEAKRIAAATYNKTRPAGDPPLSPEYDAIHTAVRGPRARRKP